MKTHEAKIGKWTFITNTSYSGNSVTMEKPGIICRLSDHKPPKVTLVTPCGLIRENVALCRFNSYDSGGFIRESATVLVRKELRITDLLRVFFSQYYNLESQEVFPKNLIVMRGRLDEKESFYGYKWLKRVFFSEQAVDYYEVKNDQK